MKKWIGGILVALRLGRLVREARELASSLIHLKQEIDRVVHKYAHIPETTNYDLRQILKCTDRVLENGADVLDIFGMKVFARRLRQWIKKELYDEIQD